MDEKTLQYIRLSEIRNFGPVSQNRLLSLCGGPDECFSADIADLISRDLQKDPKCRIGKNRLLSFDEQRKMERHKVRPEYLIAAECADKGIAVITAADTRYPERFRGIDELPAVLYIKGNLRINSFDRSVGIVGARRCSPEGKQTAIKETIRQVAQGACVISGMAKGIDSYAHTAALKAGGYTIAVLGSGPDICYPTEHLALYEAIEKHGCILSEYPPGTKAKQYTFTRRNRLIAGLCDELFVIDAGRNSGTGSTVKKACLYERKVVMI